MADVLSQTEVESLLAALNPQDKSSLRDNRPRETMVSGQSVTAYDFKRPERVSKEQMRVMHALHEGFSRELGAAISGMLRTIVEVKLISVDQHTYSEFVFSLENPTCFNLIDSKGLEGNLILDLNPAIIFPIVDRLLGGGKNVQPAQPRRALTEIELKLISRLINLALRSLESAWDAVCPLDLSVSQVESNPQLVQIVPPNEVVVLISFELTMGGNRGIMNLCIPYTCIEPLSARLSSETWSGYSRRTANPKHVTRLESGVKQAPVEIVALLAETKLTARDLRHLEVGDVLLTEHPQNDPLKVLVEDIPMFEGFAGLYRGHTAIRVAKKLPRPKELDVEEPDGNDQPPSPRRDRPPVAQKKT